MYSVEKCKTKQAWGGESFYLRLPGLKVAIVGISDKQKARISDHFSYFSIEKEEFNEAKMGNILRCECLKLDAPILTPIEEFDVKGIYTPKISRQVNKILISAFDFVADCDVVEQGTSHSSLATTTEDELATPGVIENFLRIYIAYNATAMSGAVLHSAGLVFDQRAYLFVGYSGAGKTTLTRQARAYGAEVLSDDLNLILPDKLGYAAYKVPFTGEFAHSYDAADTTRSYPLKAMCLLEQSDQLMATRVAQSSAVARLLAGSPFVNFDDQSISSLFKIYSKLSATLPVIRLGLTIENSIDDILSAITPLIEA